MYIICNNVFFYNYLQFNKNKSTLFTNIIDGCYIDGLETDQLVSFLKESVNFIYQNTYVIDKSEVNSFINFSVLEQSKKTQQTVLY